MIHPPALRPVFAMRSLVGGACLVLAGCASVQPQPLDLNSLYRETQADRLRQTAAPCLKVLSPSLVS